MRVKIGKLYVVTEGAGLDSRRMGKVICPTGKDIRQLFQDNPGYYKPFNSKREVLLQEPDGTLFSMFKQYLKEI